MWNNLINNIKSGGAIGQAIKKVSSYIAPKAQPQPSSSTGLVINYTPKNNPISAQQIVSSLKNTKQPTVDINKAVASGGLRIDSVGKPSGGSSGGNSASSFFSNAVSALVPKAYASEGNDIINNYKQSSTNPILSAIGPLAELYSGTRQSLSDLGLIRPETFNFGKLIKNIATGIVNPRQGSWGTNEYGLGEFVPNNKVKDTLGENLKYIGDIPGVINNLKGSSNYTPPTELKINDEIDKQNKLGVNRYLDQVNQANTALSGYKTSTSGGTGVDLTTIDSSLKAIDADTNAKLDALYAQYANGDMSQEEYAQKYAEEQAAASNRIYDELISQQQSEVPLLEKEFTTGKTNLESQIPSQKAEAEKIKTQNKNIYGEAMRKMVGNKEASMGNLRNMFSSLGTAESSAFINRASDLERETGTNVAQTEQELLGKISDIDQKIQDFELTIQQKVADLELEKEKQLKILRDNVNMSRQQKAAKQNEINANLYNQLAALKQAKDQQNQAFINMKAQIALNSADLLKNAASQGNVYGRVNPVETYNSGVDTSKSARNLVKNTGTYNPFGKGEYRYNPATGAYEWVNTA